MDIEYKAILKSATSWESKSLGGIFVSKKEDIDIVLEILIEQDDYWEHYKKLVMVLPDNPTPKLIISMCDYCGKADIYNMEEFLKKLSNKNIDVFIYSEFPDLID
jgi:hypothetical protein